VKKKSHMLLGRHLIDEMQSLPAERYKRVFLFGCVQPDYNLFTYFKGLRKGRFFEGHNFENAENHILRSVEKLQKNDSWSMLKYYRLGKLIHYLSDAFTSPHNVSFNVANHALYEIKLHSQLEKGIADSSGIAPKSAESVAEYILSTHRQYDRASQGLKTDVQYILDATDVVFRRLIPEEEYVLLNMLLRPEPVHRIPRPAAIGNGKRGRKPPFPIFSNGLKTVQLAFILIFIMCIEYQYKAAGTGSAAFLGGNRTHT
jgi:hypothetical protein